MATNTLPVLMALAVTSLQSFVVPAIARAADPKKKTPSPGSLEDAKEEIRSELPARGAVKKAAHSPQAPQKVLLDAWYTIQANGHTPYAYYNDRVEERGGKLFFQNHVWKKEEDYINEEQLGAYAQPGESLTPLYFNFHSVYRTTETSIDGTVAEGKNFSARIRKGGQELPVIKRTIPAKTIFAVFFPVWLKMNALNLKPGQSLPFRTILEDDVANSFALASGRIQAEKLDPQAKAPGAHLFTVDYRDAKSRWWVDDQGVVLRVEMPSQRVLVERVSGEAEARRFLEISQPAPESSGR